jgi:CTP synthase
VVKALNHAAIATSQKLQIEWVEAEHLEAGHDGFDSAWERVRGAHGVLVPGGFGDRGAEGKVAAIGYALTERTPFLGVCLGMQLAVVEYARAELGLAEATSEEFAPAGAAAEQHAVVFMPEGDRRVMGGTMRLGARDTALAPGSLLSSVYGDATEVSERHRHRYEVNPGLVGELEAAGLVFSGRNRDADLTGERMEAVELATDDHPFFVGVQFHPEYKSRPSAPAPLFRELLAAAAAAREAREREAGAPVP